MKAGGIIRTPPCSSRQDASKRMHVDLEKTRSKFDLRSRSCYVRLADYDDVRLAMLGNMTLIGHVACKSMRLGERNTLKPTPMLFLNFNKSYRQKTHLTSYFDVELLEGEVMGSNFYTGMACHKVILRYLALSL